MNYSTIKKLPRPFDARQAVETQIELLIALLDSLDGDTDLEPSLSGYSEGMVDREGDCEDEGAQCDDEGDPQR